MDTRRIVELLEPFLSETHGPRPTAPQLAQPRPALNAAQLEDISTYIDLLLRWNVRINLTAVRDPEQIVTRHFGESFFAARYLLGEIPDVEPTPVKPSAPRTVDLGSGAGFPGLPLKLWSPETPVTLIEANHKKVAFLREVIRTLTLTAIDVFAGRAEAYPPATAALVTLRAVERFEDVLPAAVRLLAPGGRLGLLIGCDQLGRAHAHAPNLWWSDPLPIPLSTSRILLAGALSSWPARESSL